MNTLSLTVLLLLGQTVAEPQPTPAVPPAGTGVVNPQDPAPVRPLVGGGATTRQPAAPGVPEPVAPLHPAGEESNPAGGAMTQPGNAAEPGRAWGDPAPAAAPDRLNTSPADRFAQPEPSGQPARPTQPEGSPDGDRFAPSAQADEGTGAAETASPPSLAVELIDRIFRSAPEGTLSGEELPLARALGKTQTSAQRIDVVKSYWRCSMLIAEYYSTMEIDQLLAGMPSPRDPTDQALLRAAQSASKSRLAELSMTLEEAQFQLAEKTDLPLLEGAPLPSDRPYIGAYRTSYEELFAQQTAPPLLTHLHRKLPGDQAWIENEAKATDDALNYLQTAMDAYSSGRLGVDRFLDATDRALTRQRALLAAIQQYNGDIADYALNLNLPGLTIEEIVGMLVKAPPPNNQSVLVSSGVKRASHDQPEPTSAEPQPTPAEPDVLPIDPKAPPARTVPGSPGAAIPADGSSYPLDDAMPDKTGVRLSPVETAEEPALQPAPIEVQPRTIGQPTSAEPIPKTP